MADRTGIELARPGTFHLQQGGEVTFTPGMLQAAARHANGLGDKFRAPLKLGHLDPRNDGEPAFGWLHNLRVEGTGAESVLLGDVTGMPQWLADTAPSAYPDRSIEGTRNPTDDTLEIDALALLGVTPPGIPTLKSWRDLPQALAAASELPIAAFAAAFHALKDAPPQLPAEPVDPPPITKEAVTMTDTLNAGLRERLGVTIELDEAALLAALDEALTEAAEPPAVTAEAIAAAYKLTPAEVTARLTTAPVAAAAGAPAGSVVITQDVLDELRIAAAAGAEARAVQLREDRDTTLTGYIAAALVTPARREFWTKKWDLDPEGTRAELATLGEPVLNIAAAGYTGTPETSDDDAFYTRLFGADEKVS